MFDRVLEARMMGETFAVREWDDSDKGVVGGIWRGEWIKVVVRFDAVAAPWAKDRNWPFETMWEAQAAGSPVLRAQVRGCEGIIRELLTWRRRATICAGQAENRPCGVVRLAHERDCGGDVVGKVCTTCR